MNFKNLFLTFVCASISFNLMAQDEENNARNEQDALVQNIRALAKGNNTFATDLYFKLKDSSDNVIASPYTVSSALSMAYAGSQGITKGQINAVMHYLPQSQNLFEAFAALNKILATSWSQGPNENKIFIANSLWVQQDMKILPDFLGIMNRYYKADFRQVDFARNPESARMQINNWVKEKTMGRIENLMEERDVSISTRMVLVASIFLKAVWEAPFDPALTKQAPFFVNPSKTVSVPMMNTTAFFPVYTNNDFTIIELPYRRNRELDPQLSFIAIVPKERFGLSKIESGFSINKLDGWLAEMQSQKVILTFPKFKMTSSFDLTSILMNLGIVAAFSEGADFSEINGDNSLMLSSVLHKAYLSVDEKGSEAVAATAVAIGVKAVLEPVKPLALEVNRPFMFLIIDRTTDSILFIGRLTLP